MPATGRSWGNYVSEGDLNPHVSEDQVHPKTNACSPVNSQLAARHEPAGGPVDPGTTTGCVGLLALIAGTVSYLHMHTLVELHGQPGWVAALTPLSVDGMIVAASTTCWPPHARGSQAESCPWALLVAGSAASLAANVAVAEPTATGPGDRRLAVVRA